MVVDSYVGLLELKVAKSREPSALDSSCGCMLIILMLIMLYCSIKLKCFRLNLKLFKTLI